MNRTTPRELQVSKQDLITPTALAQSFIYDIFVIFCFDTPSIHYLLIIVSSPAYFPLIFLFFILIDFGRPIVLFIKNCAVSEHMICTEKLASICMVPR